MANRRGPAAHQPRAERDAVVGPEQPADARNRGATWRLEEAKARFSEVVRRARDQGPQHITVRGRRAVAIVEAAELDRILPPAADVVPLVQFLEGLHVEGLDLTREPLGAALRP